jgi:DNA-binding transcriptional MerR regulator
LYRIGQFSKITKVTVKALRFYEEEGLLEPAYTDAASGYRYYSSDQLPRVFRIVALRQCGFAIPEIRQIVAGKNVAELFAGRKRELERLAVDTAGKLASINHYIESMGSDSKMTYQIVVKELPRVLVYSKRKVVASYDDFFTLMPEIGESIALANPELKCATDPAYCFNMYHDGEYKERDIDIEVCEAVTGYGNGKLPEGIEFKTIERIPEAACVLHKGPYSRLPEAYAAVFKWIEDNDCVPSDFPRESYIDGIWNKESEEDWLTELQVPILKPKRD